MVKTFQDEHLLISEIVPWIKNNSPKIFVSKNNFELRSGSQIELTIFLIKMPEYWRLEIVRFNS